MVRLLRFTVSALAGGAALAACGASSMGGGSTPTSTPLLSGIRLSTVVAPTCPVERSGQACSRPVSAGVAIDRLDGNQVTRSATGADGRTTIGLPPGRYRVIGLELRQTVGPFPERPAPVPVTVPAGGYVSILLTYETGIR